MQTILNKRGMSNWAPMISGAVTLILVAVIGTLIINTLFDQQPTGTAAQNGSAVRNLTSDGSDLFENFGDLLPILGTVLVAAIVIGLVYLFVRRNK